MPLIYFSCGWLLGIWLASVTAVPLWLWLLPAGAGLAGAIGARRQREVLLILLGLAGLGGGGVRYAMTVSSLDTNHVAFYNDREELTLTGLVVAEPDVRDRSVNLRLRGESVVTADGSRYDVRGDVLLRTFRFPVLPYGTRIEATGRLETPPEFEDFSYKDYLARQGIYSLMSLPQVTVLGENEGHPLRTALFAFKARAQTAINRLIPDPQAALLSGILLGNDSGLPPELEEDFRTTGMTHIIAISGFNVALLAGIFVRMGEPLLGRRGAALGAICGVSLYTLLVGADASVVRAAIMGSLYLISGRWLGRPGSAPAALLLAAFLMTLFNPQTLWDVGFQLSFAATLSLMLYAEPLTARTRRWLQQKFDRRTVKGLMNLLSDAVLVTLAAQALTLPLMVAYFKQLSLVSLLANTVILPLQPGVMVWGGLATISEMVIPALGQLFGWVAWLFLWATTALVQLFADVPGAAVSLSASPAAILSLYALILGATWLARQDPARRAALRARLRQDPARRAALGGSTIVALLTLSWGLAQPDGRLHVTFFDVGQGDAIFIQTPAGRQILVDGGYYPSLLNSRLGRQMPFWDREIDLLVASHPDADHVTGLVEVFDRYRVGRLLTNGQGAGESAVYNALLQAAAATGTAVHPARAGETIQIGDGVRLQVLHPGPQLDEENRNENSISLRLTYGDFSLLLTGDAEAGAERAMGENGRLQPAVVYKAGHHGSRTSSTMPLLTAVRPAVIVISAGAGNRFGHPHPEVLARAAAVGAAVLRTDRLGTIAVASDGRRMWWQANEPDLPLH